MGRCPFVCRGRCPAVERMEQMPLGYDVPSLSLRASAHAGVGLRPPTKKKSLLLVCDKEAIEV